MFEAAVGMCQEHEVLGFISREGADRRSPGSVLPPAGLRHGRAHAGCRRRPLQSHRSLPPVPFSGASEHSPWSRTVTCACHALSCLGDLVGTHEFACRSHLWNPPCLASWAPLDKCQAGPAAPRVCSFPGFPVPVRAAPLSPRRSGLQLRGLAAPARSGTSSLLCPVSLPGPAQLRRSGHWFPAGPSPLPHAPPVLPPPSSLSPTLRTERGSAAGRLETWTERSFSS